MMMPATELSWYLEVVQEVLVSWCPGLIVQEDLVPRYQAVVVREYSVLSAKERKAYRCTKVSKVICVTLKRKKHFAKRLLD